MKRFVLAAGLAFALCASASAQTPQVWTAPSGSYGLDLGSDWRAMNTGVLDSKTVLEAEYLPGNARNDVRMCSVREVANVAPQPGLTQEAVNSLVANMTTESTQSAFSDSHASALTHTTLHGVAIADAIGEGEIYRHTRMFTLLTPERALHVHILCSASTPIDEADRAAITTLVSSLNFPGLDHE